MFVSAIAADVQKNVYINAELGLEFKTGKLWGKLNVVPFKCFH